jgi:hypothetical protein
MWETDNLNFMQARIVQYIYNKTSESERHAEPHKFIFNSKLFGTDVCTLYNVHCRMYTYISLRRIRIFMDA